jgi:hypothetical protein
VQPGQALLIPRNVANHTKRKRFCEYLVPLSGGICLLVLVVVTQFTYCLVHDNLSTSLLCSIEAQKEGFYNYWQEHVRYIEMGVMVWNS